MRTENMNIFGDDTDEQIHNEEPVFYSDVMQNESNNVHNTTASNRHYGYNGRRTATRNYSCDNYDTKPKNVIPQIKENDERSYRNRLNEYLENKRQRKLENSRISFDRIRNSNPKHYRDYSNTPAPTFSKEENGRFVSQLIAAILIIMAVIFLIKGDSPFAGVTIAILVIYFMGIFNSNKKGR